MPHGALVEQLGERVDIAGVERVVSALHDRYVFVRSHVSLLLVVVSTGTAVTRPVSPRAVSPGRQSRGSVRRPAEPLLFGAVPTSRSARRHTGRRSLSRSLTVLPPRRLGRGSSWPVLAATSEGCPRV